MPIKTPVCDFGKKAENFELKSTENKLIVLGQKYLKFLGLLILLQYLRHL